MHVEGTRAPTNYGPANGRWLCVAFRKGYKKEIELVRGLGEALPCALYKHIDKGLIHERHSKQALPCKKSLEALKHGGE